MGSSALSSIHTTTTSTRGKAIQYRKKISRAIAPVEVRPAPVVQTIPELVQGVEVMPADRSEFASRLTNILIASIALIVLGPSNPYVSVDPILALDLVLTAFMLRGE